MKVEENKTGTVNEKLAKKATEFPGPDIAGPEQEGPKVIQPQATPPIASSGQAMANDVADKVIKEVAKLPSLLANDVEEPPLLSTAPRIPKVGDVVLLNLANGVVRPAMVIETDPVSRTVDLCVYFNGPKDYTLTGHTEIGTWYTAILQGEDEGQWKFRQ